MLVARSRARWVWLAAGGLVVLIGVLVALVAGRGNGPGPGGTTTTGSPLIPSVASLTCGAGGVRLGSSSVLAQADGVHFEVENETAGRLALDVGQSYGASIAPGRWAGTFPVPPGVVGVDCRVPGTAPASPSVRLRIDDPSRLWFSPVLSCPEGDLINHPMPLAFRLGTPVEIAREGMKGERAGDQFRSAGYPAQSPALVLLVRDGRAIALARLSSLSASASGSAWALQSIATCPGSGVGP